MIDVAIIGGGASGLMTAILASKNKKVVILEKFDRVGKKILVTGNGRCNLTNVNHDINNYNSAYLDIAEKLLNQLTYKNTIELFETLGLLTREDNGNIYPFSNQGASVLDILRLNLKNHHVDEICNFEVVEIEKENNYYKIISKDKKEIIAKSVVISTGGKSYFEFNDESSGYKLLKSLGHTVTPLEPTLVSLYSNNKNLLFLKGIRVKAKVTLLIDGKVQKEEIGEVLFHEKGLSGICIFNLSSLIVRNKGQRIEISLDLMYEYSDEELLKMIKKRINENIALEELMIGMMNKNVAAALLKELDYKDMTISSELLTEEDIDKMIMKIKNWTFFITGTKDFKDAQTTSGGIPLNELTDHLESKYNENLYITGEVIDVDGICGGYNLQWAWTTGYIVGKSISEKND